MDKGFNDDELADIMSEIESLEDEFTQEVEDTKETPSVKDDSEQTAVKEESETVSEEESSEPVMQEVKEHEPVLAKVAEKPEAEVVPVATHDDDNVHSIEKSESGPASTAMSFKVEGDMKLDLAFNISGKEVKLHVGEHGLEIVLVDGAKFSLPLASKSEKAA